MRLPWLKDMVNSCVSSEEMVSIPLFTYRTFKNLESVLRDTKVVNQLSFKELIDALKLYDYLHIQYKARPKERLIDAIVDYKRLETIVYDDSLVEDLKAEIVSRTLEKYYRLYNFSLRLNQARP